MIPYRIGNWIVTEDEITWDGKPKIDYGIFKSRILEKGSGERGNMYDWLLHLVSKTWITTSDVYALNSAFIYALAKYGYELDLDVFAETIIEQNNELRNK